MVALLTLFWGIWQVSQGCQPDCAVQAAAATTLIRVDGVLDETDWATAVPAADFLQTTPDEGKPATLSSEVLILHDERTLYIGAVLHDSEPDQIRRTLGRRDRFNSADWFAVALDTYNDGKTAFNFAVNASGVRVEGMLVDGAYPSETAVEDIFRDAVFGFDTSWDAEWEARVRIDSTGWTAELAIPLSALEIASTRDMSWGINFRRMIARKAEVDEWALVPTRERNGGTVSRFGTLHLEHRIRPAVHRWVTPHVNAAAVDVLTEERGILPAPGVEAELTLAPGVVIQAAAMPEFLPEDFHEYLRKPLTNGQFGVEYGRLFPASQQLIAFTATGANTLFRDLASVNTAPLILGASSLHGRLPQGLTFAGVGTVALGESLSDFPLGFVARLQQDVGKLSRVGLTGTSGPVGAYVSTTITDTLLGPVGAYVVTTDTDTAELAAASKLDWDLRIGQNTGRVAGQVAVSRVRELIIAQNVFCEVSCDPKFERVRRVTGRRTGIAARLEYGQLGKAWNWFARAEVTHPDFAVGPAGIARVADQVAIAAGVRHSDSGGNRLMKKGKFAVAASQWYSYTDLHVQETALTGHAALLTPWYNEVSVSAGGGLLSSNKWRFGADVTVASDTRRYWTLAPGLGATVITDGVRNSYAWLRVDGRAGSRITLNALVGMAGTRQGTNASGTKARAAATQSMGRAASGRAAVLGHFVAVRQCAYGYAVAPTTARSARCVFGHITGVIAITRHIDLELGSSVQATGHKQGEDTKAAPRIVSDNRVDLLAGLRWEYKRGSVISLGAYHTRTLEQFARPAWRSTWDLATLPFDGQREWIFVFRITRKVWR